VPGAGLANIKERLAAVGGGLTIASGAGRGTSIVGVIPIAPARSGGPA
jgi:signal transduction histidine kinase